MSAVYLRHSAKDFRRLFDVLKDIVTDVNIQFKKETVVITAMDPAKVSILHVVLELDSLEYYDCKQETTIGVFMPFLYKTVRSASPKDTVELLINDFSRTSMDIKLSNTITDTTHITTVTSLDLPKESIDIPINHCANVISIQAADLQKAVREVSHISKEVVIHFDTQTIVNVLVFKAGGPMGKCDIVINNPKIIYNQVPQMDIKVYTKYIEKFCKPLLSTQIDMCIYAEDAPLVLTSRFSMGIMNLFIAPIMEP